MTPVLELKDVVIRYGRIEALHGISLAVEAGELVTLLGANGAGKSTTMRGISGLTPVASGSISFEGEDVLAMKPPAGWPAALSKCRRGVGFSRG